MLNGSDYPVPADLTYFNPTRKLANRKMTLSKRKTTIEWDIDLNNPLQFDLVMKGSPFAVSVICLEHKLPRFRISSKLIIDIKIQHQENTDST